MFRIMGDARVMRFQDEGLRVLNEYRALGRVALHKDRINVRRKGRSDAFLRVIGSMACGLRLENVREMRITTRYDVARNDDVL